VPNAPGVSHSFNSQQKAKILQISNNSGGFDHAKTVGKNSQRSDIEQAA